MFHFITPIHYSRPQCPNDFDRTYLNFVHFKDSFTGNRYTKQCVHINIDMFEKWLELKLWLYTTHDLHMLVARGMNSFFRSQKSLTYSRKCNPPPFLAGWYQNITQHFINKRHEEYVYIYHGMMVRILLKRLQG